PQAVDQAQFPTGEFAKRIFRAVNGVAFARTENDEKLAAIPPTADHAPTAHGKLWKIERTDIQRDRPGGAPVQVFDAPLGARDSHGVLPHENSWRARPVTKRQPP